MVTIESCSRALRAHGPTAWLPKKNVRYFWEKCAYDSIVTIHYIHYRQQSQQSLAASLSKSVGTSIRPSPLLHVHQQHQLMA